MKTKLKNQLEEFLKLNNLISLENYENKNIKSKIKLKCQICQYEFETRIESLLDPNRQNKVCFLCRSKDQFIKTLISLYGKNSYEILSEFKGYKEPLIVKCLVCGNDFSVNKARNLLQNDKVKIGNHPCKFCSEARLLKNPKEFNDELLKRFGSVDYELLEPEKYKGNFSKEPIKIRCKLCGNEFETRLCNIFRSSNGKHYCTICNDKERLLNKMSYEKRCKQSSNGRIIPLEDYIDSRTKILHKCLVCDHEWKRLPIKNKKLVCGCPKCSKRISSSNIENKIYEFLNSKENLEVYKKQKIFKDDNQEVDVLVKNKNLAFEINGLYFHSSRFKSKLYHTEKFIKCFNQGISLINIFDDDYNHSKLAVENLLNILISDKIDLNENEIKIKDSSGDFIEKYSIIKRKANHFKSAELNGNVLSEISYSIDKRKLVIKNYEKIVNFNFLNLFIKNLKNKFEIETIEFKTNLSYFNLLDNDFIDLGFKYSFSKSSPELFYFDKKKSSKKSKKI